jgi:nucleotide-binding universal stress UspA family protein
VQAEKVYLAATDFSPDARHAAYRAAYLAAEQQAQLSLLHVLDTSSLSSLKSLFGMPADIEERVRERAVAELGELADELARDMGVEARRQVVTGDTVEEIAAAAGGAEMLVIGAHGSGGLRDLLLGSVAERLLRRSGLPVLVVKQPPHSPYRRVLIPVAFGPYSLNALRAAARFAPAAEVIVFHVFAVPFEKTLHLAGLDDEEVEKYQLIARTAALDKIENLIGVFGVSGSRFHRSVEHGEAAPKILAKQATDNSDLVVMGRQGESPLEEVLLGSVTRHVLSTSPVDVLVIGEGMVGFEHESS